MMAPTVPLKGVLTGSKSSGKRQPAMLLSKPPISQASRYILPISARSMSSAQFRPSSFHQVLTTSVVKLSLLSPHLQAAPVSATTGKSLNHYSVFRVAQNKLLPSLYITVDKTPGVGDFNCVKGALDSLPLINLVRVVIKFNPGVYTEKIEIPSTKAFITMEGGGAYNIVIQWGDTADTKNPRGFPIGTKFSATFAVESPYFIAKNITFKNTVLIPPPGAVGKQAVALRVLGDTAAFWGCRILRAHDTLMTIKVDITSRSAILKDLLILFLEMHCPCMRIVFYGQYKCTGLGAYFSGRVSWSRDLTDEEAKPFIDLIYIDGDEWIGL